MTVTNHGFTTDTLHAVGVRRHLVHVSFFDSTCTTPLTTTPTVAAGRPTDVCVKVTLPAGAPTGNEHGHGDGDVGRPTRGVGHARP